MNAFKEVHSKTAKDIIRTDLEQEWQSFHRGKQTELEGPEILEPPTEDSKSNSAEKSVRVDHEQLRASKKRKRIHKPKETLAEVAHRALERSSKARKAKEASLVEKEDCWTECEDTLSKRKYFYNKYTGESTWYNPRKWHQAQTSDGKVYWFKGKQSTWTKPEEYKEENSRKKIDTAPPGFT